MNLNDAVIICVEKVKVTQSCPTLFDPMDYRVHGILQARILEWVAIPFSRGSSQPRIEPRSPTSQAILYQLSHPKSPRILEWVTFPFSSRSSQPRNQTSFSSIIGRFFTSWVTREANINNSLIHSFLKIQRTKIISFCSSVLQCQYRWRVTVSKIGR